MKACLPAAAVAAVTLAGCATVPDTPPKEAAAAVTAAASPQAIANAQRLAGAPGSTPTAPPAPPASSLRTFADVTRDAKEMPGLLHLWQKDDKVWIELAPEQFGHLYFFSTNLDQGLGESRFLAGSMYSSLSRRFGGPMIVAFRKVGASVQLIARNVKYTAQAGTPEARAVADAFSDSLLATAPVVSQPHPERKSVLIEANTLFFADLPGAAPRLEAAYRQSYAFDARNSSLKDVRSAPDFASFSVTAHYALARVSVPPPGTPGALEPPSTLPDIRSLFLGFHYSLAKLPDTPMRPRTADARIGYFDTDVWDFTTDDRRIPIVHYVNRWRLEKKDPAAALSEPRQPIVFWIDRTVPVKYRAAITAGVLEWNKAFERIGYADAIKVEIQPDDAGFNTSDVRHASIRWMTTARSGFSAIGPTVVDPRSGEILDADIGIDATSFRAFKSLSAETIPQRPLARALTDEPYCTYSIESALHDAFAMSLLEARGEMTLDGPAAEAFIQAKLTHTTMHEVGHALGLTHNFRASTVYSDVQLADPEFTRRNGLSGSVMEYNPANIALKGERQGEYHMSTLGPYDYWAIEYGYRELASEQEATELARIAGRSREPQLAFMRDDSLYYSGLDPRVNTFDLGTDPLAYAERQIKLGRELWQLTEARTLKEGENYALLRRNFTRGLFEIHQSAQHATKFIGGLTLYSDHAGNGRAPMEPVPASKQRAALNLLATSVFAADSFRFPPAFLSRLAINDFDIDDARVLGRAVPTVDIAVDQKVLEVHRAVLAPLFSAEIAQRLLNNELKVRDKAEALTLAEMYATLHRAVWSELAAGEDIPLIRRNLQREYVSRVAMVVLRPAGTMPADARALLRADAQKLKAELLAMQGRQRLSVETRAHVAESIATLDEALKAPILRQAL
ncbi:MAG: zinc-dependent metalloprotease [Burkholderiales bacterium]|nr:zinc-dependent metalloprotease [Burkholderiales bacterium]